MLLRQLSEEEKAARKRPREEQRSEKKAGRLAAGEKKAENTVRSSVPCGVPLFSGMYTDPPHEEWTCISTIITGFRPSHTSGL